MQGSTYCNRCAAYMKVTGKRARGYCTSCRKKLKELAQEKEAKYYREVEDTPERFSDVDGPVRVYRREGRRVYANTL